MYIILFLATFVATSQSFLEEASNTTCLEHEFLCDDHIHCILLDRRCDNNPDCPDSSDESDCDMQLCVAPHFFKCKNGRCISEMFRCDEENDCLDWSDEKDCDDFKLAINPHKNKTCEKNEWKCTSDNCIADELVCNGESDCPDGSDEIIGCTKDKQCDGFKCKNQHCVPMEFRCDGQDDCRDNSDEMGCDIDPADCTIEQNRFLCHNNKTCIDINKVCNGKADCPDKSDESDKCSQFCSNCSHVCVMLPTGPKCLCPNGYKTDNDQCHDINECEIYGICDQHCENSIGSYRCYCTDGFYLLPDNRTCKAANQYEARLIFSSRHEIRQFKFASNTLENVVDNLNQSIGVDYDEPFVYWTDIYSNHECINRISLNGDGKLEILLASGLGAPEDLAIDWVTGNIYFTDGQLHNVGVCTNDATSCTVIIETDVDLPRGIVLNPKRGEIYWTDWGKKPQIRRAYMDGTNDEIFISNKISWPNDLAIDYPNERLYWTDAKVMTLESIRLDGTDRREILKEVVRHPYGIAIFEDKIYWSDWGTHSIQSCNKFTGKNHSTIINEKELIYGVTVYYPSGRDKLPNRCLKAGCSHICLLSGINNYTCACPRDMALSFDKRSCKDSLKKQRLVIASPSTILKMTYKEVGRHDFQFVPNLVRNIGALAFNSVNNTLYVSDLTKRRISEISLSTGILKDINLLGLGKIKSMDYDPLGNNLYWCDQAKATVEVLNLNTMSRKVLLHDLDGEIPESLTLVPDEGLMFIAFKKQNKRESHIDYLHMDGSGRTHCVESGLAGPITLLYDQDLNKIFSADVTVGNIEIISIDCSERHGFGGRSSSPVSMATLKDKLFWLDLRTNKIYSYDKTNERDKVEEIEMGVLEAYTNFRKTHILSITPERIGTSACQINNGNCSHLCLVSLKSFLCACPISYGLDDNNRTCTKKVNCDNDEFTCPKSNKCIPKSFLCNGHLDCKFGEDEQNCDNFNHCPTNSFQCKDGECIKSEFVCNNKYECLDKSDEHNCTHISTKQCPPNHFECPDGQCIGEQFLCDNNEDCKNGEDEMNCERAICRNDEFKCASGACIPKSWECDQHADCADSSDEHERCPRCFERSFVCTNGECIEPELVCDGDEDCTDGSDEEHCELGHGACGQSEFQCSSNTSICIPNTSLCNGISDCPHHEDEVNCSDCTTNEFTCKNKKCITAQWICDHVNDCEDNSDEDPSLCNPQKAEDTTPLGPCTDGFRCKNGQCLDFAKVCDEKVDCYDGSDEGGVCSTACVGPNKPCSHICRKTPVGAVCQCKEGYHLKGNGHTCEDINECESEPPICSQLCINRPGTYFCDCFDGFLLTTDKKSCKSKGKPMSIVFTSNDQIRERFQMDNSLKVIYSDDTPAITGLDVDVAHNYIYFTIEVTRTLIRMNKITKEMKQMSGLGSPQKLAVDWISHNVYFVTTTGPRLKSINVCNFDQHTYAPIISVDYRSQVSAIAVDPINKYIFYSSVSWMVFSSPSFKIYRANLDGRDIIELVKGTSGYVTGLAYDPYKSQLFYVDQHNELIRRINYNGSMPRTLFTNQSRPNGLNFFENHLYFLTRNGYMDKCKLYDEATCETFKLTSNGNYFAIFQESRQPLIAANLCENHTCTEMCIPTKDSYKCICSNGTFVQPKETCEKKDIIGQEPIFITPNETSPTTETTGMTEIKSKTIAIGVIVPILTVLIVLGVFHYLQKRNRNSFDLTLHFNNPIYNNRADDIEERNILSIPENGSSTEDIQRHYE